MIKLFCDCCKEETDRLFKFSIKVEYLSDSYVNNEFDFLKVLNDLYQKHICQKCKNILEEKFLEIFYESSNNED